MLGIIGIFADQGIREQEENNKAQTIKGNRQGKAGSLIPYQCGEAVISGKGEMPAFVNFCSL